MVSMELWLRAGNGVVEERGERRVRIEKSARSTRSETKKRCVCVSVGVGMCALLRGGAGVSTRQCTGS